MAEDTANARPSRWRPSGSTPVPEPVPRTGDPLDIAMDAEAASHQPGGAALRVLQAQEGLIREQTGLARNERFRNRIKAARDLAISAAVLLLIGAAGVVVWSARGAEGLVVEALSVPPDLAERGYTGGAVAARLLDKLSAMQAATDSGRAPGSYAANWAEDRSVEIPQTGVSAGQVWRTLKQALGRETRVSGEVVREDRNLSVVVRAGAKPGFTVSGPESELDSLLQDAAERLYEQSQPYRYAIHLRRTNRPAESTAIFRQLLAASSPVERAWAYNGLGSDPALPPAEAAALLRAGLRVDPRHMYLLGNLGAVEEALGHIEAARAANRRARDVLLRGAPADLNPDVVPINLLAGHADEARFLGDFAGAASRYTEVAGVPDNNGGRAAAPARETYFLALGRDSAGARAALARTPWRSDVEVMDTLVLNGGIALPFAALAAAEEDWSEAVVQLEAAEAAALALARPRDDLYAQTYIRPRRVEALARLGRFGEAETLIATTPLDCYPCLRARGRLAALRGEPSAADRWYAEAVRQAPSLPFAHAEWGEAKLARGDAAGAIRLLREAQRRGARWADPLKLEGDALAAQGRHGEAVRRYQAALKLAPGWTAARLAAEHSRSR